jgi:hypothetical protein
VLGGFLRNPPVLAHSGAGLLTITNYNDTKTYGVFTPTNTPQSGTSVDADVVSMGEVYGEYKVSYTQNPDKGTTFSRLKITYTNVNQPIWEPCTPPPPTPGCCVKCDGSDWSCCYGGSPCSDGTICCVGCEGGSWKDNWVPKKDPVPAGYTELHGEWMKINNPEDDGVSIEAYGAPFTTLDFPENYYVEFDCPVDPAEQNIQVSLMFFDENDLPYIALASSHDTDNFQFAKPLGETTKLRVKDIQGIEPGSRWELEFLAVDEKDGTDEGDYSQVLERVEGNV